MASGLCWARPYTVLFTAATILAAVWTHPFALHQWSGWVQLAALGVTPWLLAIQRARYEVSLRRLHTDEAVESTRLSEAARSVRSLQASTQAMEAQIAEITDLYHVTKETGRALHVADLFTASLNIAPRLLNASGLRLIDLSGKTPHVFRASRTTDGRMAPANGHNSVAMEQAIIKRVGVSREPASATAQQLACAFPEHITRVSWVPLWREQQAVGILVADELPEDKLKTLSIVGNQLSLQFSRVYLYQQVEALAVTDALTEVSVRSHFLERAAKELTRAARHDLSCVLFMVDLDHFKQKNDTFGHLVGDVVLKDVARVLQQHLRDIDMIARYGGEEFILMLVETDVEQAMVIAERLRQLVEAHPVRAYDELVTQTISIGVAGFPVHAETLETLIERADQALYAAKRAGRNRVVQWTESP